MIKSADEEKQLKTNKREKELKSGKNDLADSESQSDGGKINMRSEDNNLSPRFNQGKSNPFLSESLSESLKSIVSNDRKGVFLYSQLDLPEDTAIDEEKSLNGFTIVSIENFDILRFFENKRKVLTLIVYGNESLKVVSEKKDIFVFTFLEIIEFDEYEPLLDLFPLKNMENVDDGEFAQDYNDFVNKLDGDEEI